MRTGDAGTNGASRAQTIRDFLDGHDGRIEVPLRHLTTTWELDQLAPGDTKKIEGELSDAGIACSPALAASQSDDVITLTVIGRNEDPPPWDRPPATGPVVTSRRKGRNGPARRMAIGALLILTSAAVGVGAYLLGSNSGPDVDAAKADAARVGARDGAARGRQAAYEQGFKTGRRVGFRDVYRPTRNRTYRRQLTDAGVDAGSP